MRREAVPDGEETVHGPDADAQGASHTQGGAGGEKVLLFSLGMSQFGVEIGHVLEVVPHMKPTRVPHQPAFLMGIINRRGAIIPVFDLSRRLEIGACETVGPETCILILESDETLAEAAEPLGVLVDAVDEVVDIPASNMKKAPATGLGVHADFVRRVAHWKDALVVLLDIDRIHAIPEAG